MPEALSRQDRAFVERIALWSVLLVLTGIAAAGRTDTDVWGHATIGRWMLEHRAFPWTDPFSFTHDQPWVNHEWLWDLGTALLERAAGLPGLVAFRALLVAAVLWTVERAARGWSFPARLAALLVTTVACAGQWQSFRPQTATLVFYLVVLEAPAAWWLPAVFAVWANVHGGWLYGAGFLALYTVANPGRRQVTLAVACAIATLANPYGWHLWQALFEATQRGWADVSEWAPIWLVSIGAAPLVLWLACVAAIGWLATRITLPWWQWVWIAATFAAAADSRRLMSLSIITAVVFIARASGDREPAAVTWTASRRGAAAVVLATAIIVAVRLANPLNPCWPALPGVMAPEPEAVAYVRSAGLTGRAFVHFNFGLFVVGHLHDQLTVSIDNRRETVYSDAIVQGHRRFNRGEDPEYPERLSADLVWLPATLDSVIRDLEARGWHRRFDGPRTVILTRDDGPVMVVTGPTGEPCYPN